MACPKLTQLQAHEIRLRYAKENISLERLADDYGIKKSTVASIINNDEGPYFDPHYITESIRKELRRVLGICLGRDNDD